MYNYDKMKQATEMFLDAIGHPDWRNDPNTIETPDRVAKMYGVMLGGYNIDNSQHVKIFPATAQDLVVLSPIRFQSYCIHHLVPFSGILSIGYIPDKTVVGISKLARIARTHCKKLQIQENLVKDIADDLEKLLNPLGVAVQMQAKHGCVEWRGVRSPGAIMTVCAVRGILKEDVRARNEFLDTVRASNDGYKY